MITNNTPQEDNQKKLVIVSGATGDLGRAYLEYYTQLKDTTCIGLLRRSETHPISNVQYLLTSLEHRATTEETIKSIPLKNLQSITLIHPVGKFKFEEQGIPEIDILGIGIDSEVLSSNTDTFHNIVRPLVEQRNGYSPIPLTLVAFGSLSDSYTIPWWGSYSKSKLILRRDMRELARKTPQTSSIFINLSSVKTSNEHKTRPFADTTYWIAPAEIVKRSVETISHPSASYTELDLFEPSPEYHERYYQNYDTLKVKWMKEMKGGNR